VLWALWALALLSHATAAQRVFTVWQRLRDEAVVPAGPR
jgi:hypothetical protein